METHKLFFEKMILYATKQTIKELNIPMPNELSIFNNIMANKVIEEQSGDDELYAAYRELQEETGITNNDIVLTNIMNFQYKISEMELEVYAGRLNKDVKLIEEINKLYWIDKKENFFDIDKFAGEGNIGHMMQQVEINKNK